MVHVVKETLPYPARYKPKMTEDEFERYVFDTAHVFTVAGYYGGEVVDLGPRLHTRRYYRAFDNLPDAIAHAAEKPRCCVYAANPPGRQIVLDRRLLPMWLERYNKTRQGEPT